MKLMSEKRAAQMHEEYEKLSELEQRRVERIMRDSADIATPKKQVLMLLSGIFSVIFIIAFIDVELWLFANGNTTAGILFLFPLLLLFVGPYGIYFMYRVMRRTTLEGATECLLKEKEFKKSKIAKTKFVKDKVINKDRL